MRVKVTVFVEVDTEDWILGPEDVAQVPREVADRVRYWTARHEALIRILSAHGEEIPIRTGPRMEDVRREIEP